MAIVLDEAEADACMSALAVDESLLISAGTLAEAFIVAMRRTRGGSSSVSRTSNSDSAKASNSPFFLPDHPH
jgi:uncharacterized protein with PIN domain